MMLSERNLVCAPNCLFFPRPQKVAARWGTLRLLGVLFEVAADLVYQDHMIDRTRSARIHIINANPSAGPDPGLDDFTLLVQNVTRSVENVTTRGTRPILANDERIERLITGGHAFLRRHLKGFSRDRYWFRGCLFVF
jgi:hypothetical protein